jgi:hypothetical protein
MIFMGNATRKYKLPLVVSGLLVIAISPLILHYCVDGAPGHSRLEAIDKGPFKSPEGVRQKATNRPALALHKTKVNLNFVSYSFLLRFDLKQNLRSWPVLSNDLERSPPFLPVL